MAKDTDTGPLDVPDDVQVIEQYEDLVEQDPLIRIFGTHAKTRILMALHAAPEPLNPSRIQEVANIGQTSWYRHKDELLETGLVVKTGNAGNSPLYALEKPENDLRVEWLEKLVDWTAAYRRDGTRPTREE